MEREGASIDTLKKQTIRNLQVGIAVGSERLREVVESGSIKPGELSIAVGVMVDKAALLAGEATARVEHVRRGPSHADLNELLDSLPAANVLAVETVSSGENAGTKGRAVSALPGAKQDSQSCDLKGNPDSATAFATDSGQQDTADLQPDPSAKPENSTRFTGGEGVPENAGGVVQQSDQEL
jgi:hypothetical protein